MGDGFYTFALTTTPQPWSPWAAPPAPVVLNAAPPAPKQLVGWKAIIACSEAHGGPSTEQHLRRLANGDPFCPIWGPKAGQGAVVAIDAELIWWLKMRRAPLGMRRLYEKKAAAKGKGGKKKPPRRAA